MSDRLFQTISSGRPYHVVKQSSANSSRAKLTKVRRAEATITESDVSRTDKSHVPCAAQHSNTRVNVFDMEAQQHSGKTLTTRSHLLGPSSKKTIVTTTDSQGGDTPHMNLWGIPLTQNRRHRTTLENRHRRYQFLINNFLERPNGRCSVLYHLFVWVMHPLIAHFYTTFVFSLISYLILNKRSHQLLREMRTKQYKRVKMIEMITKHSQTLQELVFIYSSLDIILD